MTLPPKVVRRLIVAPAYVILTFLAVTALPLALIIAAFASRYVPGRWRPLRLLWFGFVWMVLESVMLVALFALWVGSGFGWKLETEAFQLAHYQLLGWFLRLVVGSAKRTFGLDIVTQDPDPIDDEGRPLLVLARHAGPGDSLLLVQAVTERGRRPRIVLKEFLQWDPAIDVLLNRIPSEFIGRRGSPGRSAVEAIGSLAGSMGPEDALVIFPEGANFTPARWARAVAKLEEAGLSEFARRAGDMEHLLPPKPNGVLAAVRNAPRASVVLVGHAGLENLNTLADIWSGLRMDITVETRLWRTIVSELPADDEGLKNWLYDRWGDMNLWLARTRA